METNFKNIDIGFSFNKNYRKNFLIHYTTFEGLKSIIENKELWFTHADFVNDITEGKYFENLYNEVIDEYEQRNKCSESLLKSLRKDNIFQEWMVYYNKNAKDETNNYKLGKPNTFICSFSMENDSLPMWNYYGKIIC